MKQIFNLISRIIHRKYFYLFFYAAVSLAILGPLLLPGAVLSLDMRLGPNVDFIPQFYGLTERTYSVINMPFYFVLWIVDMAIPFWLWQKALLFSIFFLAGVGAHRLLPENGSQRYFAGLLYTMNPFIYVRFLAGQWVILGVYALIPFAIKSFIQLMEERGWRNAASVALLATLVGIMYGHGFFILFLAFFIIWLTRILTLRDKASLMETVKYTAIAAAMFILLNTYWLVPLLTAPKTFTELISKLDLLGFAPTHTSNLGVMFDVASMYGFWRGGYIYTKDILPGWWLLYAFILFLAIYGFLSRRRDKETGWLTYALATTALVSFLLAVGAGSDITRPLFELLWEHIPYFNIFRDSQKFVALLCLAYAYLGGLGTGEFALILKQAKRRLPKLGLIALTALSLATPVIYSFTIFGFHGQLGVTDYPDEWYEVNSYLNQEKGDFNVLFLPWHEFIDFSWLPNRDKRLGNPAAVFFDKPIIQGDNIEMPEIYSQSTNPVSKYVEFLLGKREDIENLGELLSPLNVKYVMLVDEADYQIYDFLYDQRDLKVALKRPGITLFENEHPVARVYGVGGITPIRDLEEYLELSRSRDVMESLYLMDNGKEDGTGEMQALGFAEKSPIAYEVEGCELRYIIFTVPQAYSTESWSYGEEKPLKNLGFMPAFTASPEGGEVIYTRFYRIYLPSYIVSALMLSAAIASCLRTKPKGKPSPSP